MGKCCPNHGNLKRALALKEAVKLTYRHHRKRPPARSEELQPVATAFYRSKDEAEQALQFLGALCRASGMREVEFVRELGCDGSARFYVWQAVGIPQALAGLSSSNCLEEPNREAGSSATGTLDSRDTRGRQFEGLFMDEPQAMPSMEGTAN